MPDTVYKPKEAEKTVLKSQLTWLKKQVNAR